MGCNTSQELKTKDGNAGSANGEGELVAEATNAANTANTATSNGNVGGAVSVGEQNGNLAEQQKAVGGGSAGSQTRKTASAASAVSATSAASAGSAATATSNNLTNHSKSNSIISNGDANKRSASRDEGDGGILEKALAAVKQQCDKAEITEFNDMSELGELGELGEDEAKAATKIQAVFRGHKVRNTMKKSETKSTPTASANAASANKIDHSKTVAASAAAAAAAAAAEPTKAELEAEFDPNDKELCDAAAKIQAAFRGHMTRKVVTKDTPDDIDIQEITKKVAEELDIDLSDPELNKAATKIQASFRGHKIRKEIGTE
ncbi:uncharacterized protein LOC126755192 isoform X1 [Bactrocera neohumeralis]|uniref:uncharacterized protein LOC126755192 isoform X1 n=1 Tax=Bactrocera neohumeralis TaxID=98809 RepID=UPI0021653244|nr:uncharacterized protein LOC126755192 isoform X1 [Bactrocera neohumeralis]